MTDTTPWKSELKRHNALLTAERDALKAENERMRDALNKLIDAANDSDDARYGTIGTSYVRDIARAALNTGEQE